MECCCAGGCKSLRADNVCCAGVASEIIGGCCLIISEDSVTPGSAVTAGLVRGQPGADSDPPLTSKTTSTVVEAWQRQEHPNQHWGRGERVTYEGLEGSTYLQPEPVFGNKLLGTSTGRAFGALKGLSYTSLYRIWQEHNNAQYPIFLKSRTPPQYTTPPGDKKYEDQKCLSPEACYALSYSECAPPN